MNDKGKEEICKRKRKRMQNRKKSVISMIMIMVILIVITAIMTIIKVIYKINDIILLVILMITKIIFHNNLPFQFFLNIAFLRLGLNDENSWDFNFFRNFFTKSRINQ